MALSNGNGLVTKCLLGVCILSLLAGLFFPSNRRDNTSAYKHDNKPGAGVTKLFAGNRLVRVSLNGPISMEGDSQGGGLFDGESNAMSARKALEKALNDDSVKGVLIRIDSPGGTVGMSQELNGAIKRLIAAKKPVVASLGDLAASGGYYTACAANKIVANPGTLTGSIGVILSTMNVKGLLVDKLGLKPVTIKSGKFKDLLSPYRETTKDEVDLLQNMINVSYKQFLKAVLDGRLLNVSDPVKKAELTRSITAVADGRVVVATEAVKAGLVDAIGDETDAKNLLIELVRQNGVNISKDIELENASENKRLMEWLGVGASAVIPRQPSWMKMPFSAMHPHQPLWMYEP